MNRDISGSFRMEGEWERAGRVSWRSDWGRGGWSGWSGERERKKKRANGRRAEGKTGARGGIKGTGRQADARDQLYIRSVEVQSEPRVLVQRKMKRQDD